MPVAQCLYCEEYRDDVREVSVTFYDERYGHTYETTVEVCGWHMRTLIESPLTTVTAIPEPPA